MEKQNEQLKINLYLPVGIALSTPVILPYTWAWVPNTKTEICSSFHFCFYNDKYVGKGQKSKSVEKIPDNIFGII